MSVNKGKGGSLLYQPYLCAEPEVDLQLPPSFADANATSLQEGGFGNPALLEHAATSVLSTHFFQRK